jgi:cysteine desulfurase / selenocysteine lyase
MFDCQAFREEFPFYHKDSSVVYFDSAATTLKPKRITDIVENYLKQGGVNPGKGGYPTSKNSEKDIEEVRFLIKEYLGASQEDVLIFTSGATQGMQLCSSILKKEIVDKKSSLWIGSLDHRSTVSPWIKMTQDLCIPNQLKMYGYTSEGNLRLSEIVTNAKDESVLVLTHAHNVFGVVNSPCRLSKSLNFNHIIVLDCAQTVSHFPLSLKVSSADFAVASGHKMFGLPGVGFLWIQNKHRRLVADAARCCHSSPDQVIENGLGIGSLNSLGILSLKSSIELVSSFGKQEICEYVCALERCLKKVISGKSELRPVNCWKEIDSNSSVGICSFTIDGVSSREAELFFADTNFALRTGDHCTRSDFFNEVDALDCIRISLHAYNSFSEIVHFAGIIDKLNSGNPTNQGIVYTAQRPIDELLIHEEVCSDRLIEVRNQIKKDKNQYPILIDKSTGVILDGHHRYKIALEEGLRSITCVEIDYFNDSLIGIGSWREDKVYRKEDVLSAAFSMKPLPPKSTKHEVYANIAC